MWFLPIVQISFTAAFFEHWKLRPLAVLGQYQSALLLTNWSDTGLEWHPHAANWFGYTAVTQLPTMMVGTSEGVVMTVRVAVIGVGPCGLSQLRAFQQAKLKGADIPEVVCFEKQSDWSGLWNYTWRAGTDQYGEPVHCSMVVQRTEGMSRVRRLHIRRSFQTADPVLPAARSAP